MLAVGGVLLTRVRLGLNLGRAALREEALPGRGAVLEGRGGWASQVHLCPGERVSLCCLGGGKDGASTGSEDWAHPSRPRQSCLVPAENLFHILVTGIRGSGSYWLGHWVS